MNKKIYVIGHKSPDTDSVVSAIVFSDYLKKKKFNSSPAVSGKINNETSYVLSFAKEKKPTLMTSAGNKSFFLVDHGNLAESVIGLKESSIVGVLDHHKMSGISTDKPIFYRTEPIGSTSTLVFKMFDEAGLKLTVEQSKMLLCGIISDTLKFTSPTTTKEDEKIALLLAKKTKTKISKLSTEIFRAKSDISKMTPKNIVLSDYKEFDFSKAKVGVSVHETTFPSGIYKIKKNIFKEIKQIKKEKGVDLIFFAVIDILNKKGFLYLDLPKERDIAQKAFSGKIGKDLIMPVSGMLSRKKQIIPPLSEVLN